MITGAIKNQIDQIWNAFWSGGISNPIEVIEQITYLLFIRRLDDLHTLEENKSARLKRPIARRVFPESAVRGVGVPGGTVRSSTVRISRLSAGTASARSADFTHGRAAGAVVHGRSGTRTPGWIGPYP